MPRDGAGPREAAERRVRERQARRMAAFVKWQQEECRRDFRAQKQVLDQLTVREAALTDERRRAAERSMKEWEQERRKLTGRAAPVPAFAMMGAPPRDVSEEYRLRRAQWEQRDSALSERFDRRLEACRRGRAEMQHRFLTANQARDRKHEQDRAELAHRQAEGFERAVRREMERGREPVREEFARKGRAREGHDRGLT